MGFSLEALVAIPCCLSILAHTAGLAGPVATEIKGTARITAYAALQTRSDGDSCRHYLLEREGARLPLVETSPQKIVETLSLVRDLSRTLKAGFLPEEGSLP